MLGAPGQHMPVLEQPPGPAGRDPWPPRSQGVDATHTRAHATCVAPSQEGPGSPNASLHLTPTEPAQDGPEEGLQPGHLLSTGHISDIVAYKPGEHNKPGEPSLLVQPFS